VIYIPVLSTLRNSIVPIQLETAIASKNFSATSHHKGGYGQYIRPIMTSSLEGTRSNATSYPSTPSFDDDLKLGIARKMIKPSASTQWLQLPNVIN